MTEPRVGEALERLAAGSSRRGFLGRLGSAIVGASAAGFVAKAIRPGEADAYHFCGHTYTTDSCPHPMGKALPRIDSNGFPLRPSDGHPVDNLGRLINQRGEPLGSDGRVLRDPDGRPLPPAPRTPICDNVGAKFGFETSIDGSWYRCCAGRVRKLMDCCSYSDTRINGDAALTGYCYQGRKVFCVTYLDTNVPC